jgi:hypothetical protein
VDSGQWAVDSGQWTVGSGQWTVDSGQWTVDSGQWPSRRTGTENNLLEEASADHGLE